MSIAGTLVIASEAYPLHVPEHRTLNVTVTEIKGDTLYYKTEEGTTRTISLKVVEQYERVGNVKIGEDLVMEFDEGNQVIRVNRPDRLTVSGELTNFDHNRRQITLKLKNGTSEIYTVIPPVAPKVAVVPEGTTVWLEIDVKNNMVKDIRRE
jgi:hypothetical protein